MHAKVWGWLLAGVGAVGLAVSVWLFVWLGLDKGNQLAGIVSCFVAVAGLFVAVYGVILTRRGQVGARPLISRSSVGGSADDWEDVHGDIKIHRISPTAPPPPLPPGSPGASAPSDAMVDGSWIGGSVRRARGVDGGIEITE